MNAHAPPQKRASAPDQEADANPSRPAPVNHIGAELAIPEASRQNQSVFAASLERSAYRTDQQLRQLKRRLKNRIKYQRGQLLGLTARLGAVETEMSRRGLHLPSERRI